MKLIKFIILVFLILSCGEKIREEIVDRYTTGEKRIVVGYKGTGSDEILVYKLFYNKQRQLFRKIDILEDIDTIYNEIELPRIESVSEYYESGKKRIVFTLSWDGTDETVAQKTLYLENGEPYRVEDYVDQRTYSYVELNDFNSSKDLERYMLGTWENPDDDKLREVLPEWGFNTTFTQDSVLIYSRANNETIERFHIQYQDSLLVIRTRNFGDIADNTDTTISYRSKISISSPNEFKIRTSYAELMTHLGRPVTQTPDELEKLDSLLTDEYRRPIIQYQQRRSIKKKIVSAPSITDFEILSLSKRWEYGTLYVIGEVRNNGNRAAGVQIEAIARDRNGGLVDSIRFWPASISNIPAGSTAGIKHPISEDTRAVEIEVKVVDVRIWRSR